MRNKLRLNFWLQAWFQKKIKKYVGWSEEHKSHNHNSFSKKLSVYVVNSWTCGFRKILVNFLLNDNPP